MESHDGSGKMRRMERDFSVSETENDREEWKTAFVDDLIERGMQTMCAFLNSFGGRVIFGVNPSGGQVSLTGDLDGHQLRIHERIQAHLKPNARQHIDVAVHDGRLYVFVRPDHSTIYTYRNVVYKRTGSSTHPLTFQQSKELEEQRSDHIKESAPGTFTRITQGESLQCKDCDYSEVSGMSIGVSVGAPPTARKCPQCGGELVGI